jgi:hypothetical protein
MNPEMVPKIEKGTNSKDYKEIINSPEFKEWFNNSVIVDKHNTPLVTYHSTLIKNLEGTSLKRNETATDWNLYGIYFSSNREATERFFKELYENKQQNFDRYKTVPSERYSKEELEKIEKEGTYFNHNEATVKTFNCFLKIENPLILENHSELMDLHYSGATRESLMNNYDGIIIKQDSDFTDQYIVFNSDQIYILPSILK